MDHIPNPHISALNALRIILTRRQRHDTQEKWKEKKKHRTKLNLRRIAEPNSSKWLMNGEWTKHIFHIVDSRVHAPPPPFMQKLQTDEVA